MKAYFHFESSYYSWRNFACFSPAISIAMTQGSPSIEIDILFWRLMFIVEFGSAI